MEIYFLRHGLAGSRGEWRGDDRERPLTEEGARRMVREAAAMARMGLRPDLIVTSPLARAYQTADIAARGLGLSDRVLVDDRLALGFGLRDLSAILGEHPKVSSIMLVGHEPDFSMTISALIGGGDIVCKKGGLARVDAEDVSPGSGVLTWLLPPSVLAS